MPPQHVSEPGPEHVRLKQRAFFRPRRQPPVVEPPFHLAQLRGQAAASVAAEQVAPFCRAKPGVAVLGDPHPIGRNPRRAPCPCPVAPCPPPGHAPTTPAPTPRHTR